TMAWSRRSAGTTPRSSRGAFSSTPNGAGAGTRPTGGSCGRMSTRAGRASTRGEDRPRHLRKARATLTRCDVARRMRELGFEPPDVRHADAVREMLEHQHVVGRIADIDPVRDLGVEVA